VGQLETLSGRADKNPRKYQDSLFPRLDLKPGLFKIRSTSPTNLTVTFDHSTDISHCVVGSCYELTSHSL